MHSLRRFVEFIRWPVVSGVMIALVLLMIFPNMIPGSSNPINEVVKIPVDGPAESQWQGPVSYSKAVQRAAPAVVNIYTSKESSRKTKSLNGVNRSSHPLMNDPVFRQLFNISSEPEQARMESALGSGVIVSEDGYLLTNLHLINGADEIIVALQDGRDAEAQLVGINRESDLAVLKIELANLIAIPMGSPDQVRVGDVVLAIGNPFGMGQTVTQGIVSATRRRGLNISFFEDFIQTDAAINPGNSGGALIDARGNLLGINAAQFNPSSSNQQTGFGFAIPADTALQTLQDIVEYGHVVRGWLGIEATPVTMRAAEVLSLENTDGIRITNIVPNSPAHMSGLLRNDVITHINKRAVGKGIWGFQEIAESRPGELVEIDIVREGEKIKLDAVVAESPKLTSRTRELPETE